MDEGTPLADRLRPYLRDLSDRDPADKEAPSGPPQPPAQPPADPPAAEIAPVAPVAPRQAAQEVAPTAPQGEAAPVGRSGSSAGDFTEAVMLRPTPRPPARGWQRVLRVASLGTYQPRLSASERAHSELVQRIRTPVQGRRRIAVISRKGGVGKTTTTLMLGHTLAQQRGDRVLALDGNPDAGSLGYRVPRETTATITDVLDAAADATSYSDMRRYTSQAPSRLEVIASDDDPHISQAIGEDEYRELIAVVERHYNLILLDTGTGILDSATQGILRMADQLVLVLAPSLDGSRAAGLTLDWLESHGYGALAADAVAVVNQARTRGMVEVLRVEDHFRARCREVVRIPWDSRLEAGGEAGLDELDAATRQAYLELAAAVADGFALPRAR